LDGGLLFARLLQTREAGTDSCGEGNFCHF
jgi:hypothetical protein